jgi:hypothetical protein
LAEVLWQPTDIYIRATAQTDASFTEEDLLEVLATAR